MSRCADYFRNLQNGRRCHGNGQNANKFIVGSYYGGYSYKMDHNTAPKPWISIPNIKIYLETKFRPKRRIFVFWRPNGHHSKPTMDINSQHHNLLGNQISVAILNPKWPLKYKNLPFWTKFGFQVDFDVGN
jgi:hypothetical protein